MVIVDEAGNVLESVDLSLGRLEDAEWDTHPEVPEKGHYEYKRLATGATVQDYVIDTPKQAAWREVVKQKYVPYTDEELALMKKSDYGGRLEALEAKAQEAEKAEALLSAQVQAVSDRGDFVEDCLAEIAGVVYA